MTGGFDREAWIALACSKYGSVPMRDYEDTVIGFHVIDEPHLVSKWGAMAKCPGCGRCACCCTCPKKAA